MQDSTVRWPGHRRDSWLRSQVTYKAVKNICIRQVSATPMTWKSPPQPNGGALILPENPVFWGVGVGGWRERREMQNHGRWLLCFASSRRPGQRQTGIQDNRVLRNQRWGDRRRRNIPAARCVTTGEVKPDSRPSLQLTHISHHLFRYLGHVHLDKTLYFASFVGPVDRLGNQKLHLRRWRRTTKSLSKSKIKTAWTIVFAIYVDKCMNINDGDTIIFESQLFLTTVNSK